MKRLLFLVLAALAFAPVTHAKINIVCTTSDFGAITREVTGALADVTVLAKPSEDPHFVDAKPSFIIRLNKADALVEGGAELEVGWLPPLLESARNPKIAAGAPGHIACHEGIQLLEVPASLDRSKGDLHAAGNPHYTTDPALAKTIASTICDHLCKIDAANCNAYHANLAAFQNQLDEKLIVWKKLLAPFKGQRVTAYHNSWPYFGKRFEINTDLFLEPKPGIPPTPVHLQKVIEQMKAEKIKAILASPYVSVRTGENVAERTGAKVLDFPQFPATGKTATYIGWMDYLVNNLVSALAGKGGG